jgi:Chorismate synthase
MTVENLDHGVWRSVMGPLEVDAEAAAKRRLSSPRPGHADLPGGLKYGRRDLRDVLERASARETAARVAAGAVCRQLLAACGIEVRSGVLSVGPVSVEEPREGFSFATLANVDDASPFRAVDPSLEEKMTQAVDAAAKKGTRSAGRSSSPRAASRPASGRTSRGTGSWTGGSARRCSRSRR